MFLGTIRLSISKTIDRTSFHKIIGTQFHPHSIPRKNSYIITLDLSRYVSRYMAPIIWIHSKHHIRKWFSNCTLHVNKILFFYPSRYISLPSYRWIVFRISFQIRLLMQIPKSPWGVTIPSNNRPLKECFTNYQMWDKISQPTFLRLSSWPIKSP